MPNYDVVPDYIVDVPRRNTAEQTLQIVPGILNIKKPELRWMTEKNFGPQWFEDSVLGWCAKDGRTIFIRDNCSPFQVVNTIVHECRHCWQIQNPKRVPIPGKTYTRTMNREQAERDCRIFEMEFWNGREKRDGSFDEIERILTAMQIETARAQVQAASPQYNAVKHRIGPSCSSSFAYPASGKTRLFVANSFKRDDDDEDECWA